MMHASEVQSALRALQREFISLILRRYYQALKEEQNVEELFERLKLEIEEALERLRRAKAKPQLDVQ